MTGTGRRVTLRQRVRYRIDMGLSKGVLVVAAWLTLGMLVLIAVGALVIWWAGLGPAGRRQSLAEDLWLTLTRSLDSGAFGQDEGTEFRIVTVTITIAGIMALAVLIAVVTASIERRLELLRRGRSLVVEREHTLILGSSSKLVLIISELIAAHEHGTRPVIVVLSPEDNVDVEQRIRRTVPKSRSARVVVRRGDPTSLGDLAMVRPETAHAIVILRPESADGDAEVVRVAVAVVRNLARPDTTVIAELHDGALADNLEKALERKMTPVVPTRIVPRIIAQSLRAAGLGRVFKDLLNFEGHEFYAIEPPWDAAGLTPEETPFAAWLEVPEQCVVVGYQAEKRGHLAPRFDTHLEPEDRLIVVAENQARAHAFASGRELTTSAAPKPDDLGHPGTPPAPPSGVILIIGWNDTALEMARELGRSTHDKVTLHVLVDPSWRDTPPPISVDPPTGQVTVDDFPGTSTDEDTVVHAIADIQPDHILVLSSHADAAPTVSDARTLLTLRHVAHALERQPPSRPVNVVAELHLRESVTVAEKVSPGDFIVSEHLVSLLIAQYAEYRKRRWMLDRLFDADGPQVELHPAVAYTADTDCTFGELVRLGRERGVIVIGWQDVDGGPEHRAAEHVNPAKSAVIDLNAGDQVIALVRRGAEVTAEGETPSTTG